MKYFLRTLKYSRLTNVSLCFSIDLPIAQSGTGDFKRAAVSSCQWPEKSLYEVQSWPSLLSHHHSLGAADTGHSHHCWLLSLIWPLIDVTTAVPPPCVRCELACLLLPHTHSSHDSRPRTSWKTIVSQEDKLGQTIERNSQLIPGQKDSCIINHFMSVELICNFEL